MPKTYLRKCKRAAFCCWGPTLETERKTKNIDLRQVLLPTFPNSANLPANAITRTSKRIHIARISFGLPDGNIQVRRHFYSSQNSIWFVLLDRKWITTLIQRGSFPRLRLREFTKPSQRTCQKRFTARNDALWHRYKFATQKRPKYSANPITDPP